MKNVPPAPFSDSKRSKIGWVSMGILRIQPRRVETTSIERESSGTSYGAAWLHSGD